MSTTRPESNDDHITTCECDGCGAKSVPCALFHCRGTPVLGLCQKCDPKAFFNVTLADMPLQLHVIGAILDVVVLRCENPLSEAF